MEKTKRSIGWMGMSRGHRAKPMEWLVEKLIFAVSLSSILVIFLLFIFIGQEALPVILGKASHGSGQKLLAVDQLDKLSPRQIQDYLEITPSQEAAMDRETLKTLMELKLESGHEQAAQPDGDLDTASWPFLIKPHQWSGYAKPVYVWQPVSNTPKYNIVPLITGSLKVTIVALLFSFPLALAAALYVSQIARPGVRELVKPAIELLAGLPSVVLGFFALIVMASWMQSVLHYQSRLNALCAGIALGISVIPVVFSLAEDALTSVPRHFVQGALALGASRWKAAVQVVLPAALPGVFAALAIGFGRAIGETMVVLMASGNASILSWNFLDSARTITASIAAELGEVVFGSPHYRILFLIGILLLVVTFISNLIAEVVMHQLKARMEGKR